MKKTTKLILTMLAAALVLFGVMSCKPGFTVRVGSLKGETILFITDGNGKNYVTFTFNDDASGGTWETGRFDFGFPTESDATIGDYTLKEWYMTGGDRGTFTYDKETERMTSIITHVWKLKDGEQGAPPHYKDEYDWATYTESELGYGVPAGDSATWTEVADTFLSYDTPTLKGFLDQGDDTNRWGYYQSTTETETVSGSTTTTVTETTETYTITETEVVYDKTEVITETVDSGTPARETFREISTYRVNNFFVSGKATESAAFDTVWKEGNEVTFLLERTKYEDIWYEGENPPSAPTVDESTGEGTNSGATFSYYIDLRGGTAPEWAFIHAGATIFMNTEFIYSYRGL